MDQAIKDAIGQKIITVCMPMVFLMGIIGNPLSFMIYSRRTFKDLKTSLFLRVLSVSDTLEVLMFIFPLFDYGFVIPLSAFSHVGCKLYKYIQYVACACSAHIEAFISFERMVCVIAPSRSFRIFSIDLIGKSSIIFICLFNALIYLPMAITYEPVDITSSSTSSNESSILNDTQNINGSNLNETIESSDPILMCQSNDPNFDKYL